MNTFIITLCVVFCTKNVWAAEYIFEFGVDQGNIIYTKDGVIPLFQYQTNVNIPVGADSNVSYIKVTVNSLSPPKVDYDNFYHNVRIVFSWTQVTVASFNIIAKGIQE